MVLDVDREEPWPQLLDELTELYMEQDYTELTAEQYTERKREILGQHPAYQITTYM